jgi:hypothetical protein
MISIGFLRALGSAKLLVNKIIPKLDWRESGKRTYFEFMFN